MTIIMTPQVFRQPPSVEYLSHYCPGGLHPVHLGNTSSEELHVLSRLREGVEEQGQQYVIQLLDHFEHEGPNGIYQCFVKEVLGPILSQEIDEVHPEDCFPPEVSRRLVSQVAMGVNFLHKRCSPWRSSSRKPSALLPENFSLELAGKRRKISR